MSSLCPPFHSHYKYIFFVSNISGHADTTIPVSRQIWTRYTHFYTHFCVLTPAGHGCWTRLNPKPNPNWVCCHRPRPNRRRRRRGRARRRPNQPRPEPHRRSNRPQHPEPPLFQCRLLAAQATVPPPQFQSASIRTSALPSSTVLSPERLESQAAP